MAVTYQKEKSDFLCVFKDKNREDLWKNFEDVCANYCYKCEFNVHHDLTEIWCAHPAMNNKEKTINKED
jgi:hypothetical protein